jgi:SAM-dependent methyltransferase
VSLRDKILGLPFVYNVVRPIVVGGIDMGPVLSPLEVHESDVVVDVGCGTGIALEHLPRFRRYVGFDTDERALTAAARRTKARLQAHGQEQIEFRNVTLDAAAVAELSPDIVILAGLLHHLDDQACEELLRTLRSAPKLRTVVTLDVTFLPGRLVNNLLTVLDRGQYPRHPAAYNWLASRAGFAIDEAKTLPARPGNDRVEYWWMKISPAK